MSRRGRERNRAGQWQHQGHQFGLQDGYIEGTPQHANIPPAGAHFIQGGSGPGPYQQHHQGTWANAPAHQYQPYQQGWQGGNVNIQHEQYQLTRGLLGPAPQQYQAQQDYMNAAAPQFLPSDPFQRAHIPQSSMMQGNISFANQQEHINNQPANPNTRPVPLMRLNTRNSSLARPGNNDLSSNNRRRNFSMPRKGNISKNDNQGRVSIGKPSADDVFNFMVRKMNGRGTPKDIKLESGLFPEQFDSMEDWFLEHKSKFKLFERNGDTKVVQVYNEDATCCFAYNNNSCKRNNCRRYHICKHMVAGKCDIGSRKGCKYSHDFKDSRNKRVSEYLGYSDTYTDTEICSIVKASMPHLCIEWAKSSSCDAQKCIGLHLCPRYMLGKCKNGLSCPKVHDRKSDHNRPILDTFNMTNMQHKAFTNRVFMIYNATWQQNTEDEEADAAGSLYICDQHLVGNCHFNGCKYLHSDTRLPYLWQIKLDERWLTLEQSECIEREFSNNLRSSDTIDMRHEGADIVVILFFNLSIKAKVFGPNGDNKTEARRLSTLSYKDAEITCSESKVKQQRGPKGRFYTQWRWYWKDDYRQWQPFEPDIFQHTLETKYLAKQTTFIYSMEEFSFNDYYKLSFASMLQKNTRTGNRRDISRRPIFVSSEDVERLSFPKSLSAAPVVDTALPSSWQPWDLLHPYELIDLVENELSEAQKVLKIALNSIERRKETIETIYRLQNRKLWDRFCSRKRTMEGEQNVKQTDIPLNRYLFHSTENVDDVLKICTNNFDVRETGKGTCLYGDGAYFTKDCKDRHNFKKGPDRYVFVVDVLTGRFTEGDSSFKSPPNIPGSYQEFDSCVDDTNDPAIFVVFDKNQFYPEFLIKCRQVECEDMRPNVDEMQAKRIQYSKGRVTVSEERSNEGSWNSNTEQIRQRDQISHRYATQVECENMRPNVDEMQSKRIQYSKGRVAVSDERSNEGSLNSNTEQIRQRDQISHRYATQVECEDMRPNVDEMQSKRIQYSKGRVTVSEERSNEGSWNSNTEQIRQRDQISHRYATQVECEDMRPNVNEMQSKRIQYSKGRVAVSDERSNEGSLDSNTEQIRQRDQISNRYSYDHLQRTYESKYANVQDYINFGSDESGMEIETLKVSDGRLDPRLGARKKDLYKSQSDSVGGRKHKEPEKNTVLKDEKEAYMCTYNETAEKNKFRSFTETKHTPLKIKERPLYSFENLYDQSNKNEVATGYQNIARKFTKMKLDTTATPTGRDDEKQWSDLCFDFDEAALQDQDVVKSARDSTKVRRELRERYEMSRQK